jgi:CubicO group peptidase (beta-lactamase class C family)
MTNIQTPAGLTPRGLGWEMDWLGSLQRGDLFPHEGFGHTGYTGTSIWADKESGTIVVILSNRVHPTDAGDAAKLRRRVANIIAAEIYRQMPWVETKSLPTTIAK